MSSINSVNPGVSDLLKAFSKTGSSPLPAALSTTAVQSALAIASPQDLVQLSEQALQLQQAGGLFGGSGSSDVAAGNSTAQSVLSPTSGSNSTVASAPVSPPGVTSQTFAEQEAAALFGTNVSAGWGNSTISLLG